MLDWRANQLRQEVRRDVTSPGLEPGTSSALMVYGWLLKPIIFPYKKESYSSNPPRKLLML